MILTLSFDDSQEGETEKYETMLKAADFNYVIRGVLEYLRKQLKVETLNEVQRDSFEKIQEKIWNEIIMRNLEGFF